MDEWNGLDSTLGNLVVIVQRRDSGKDDEIGIYGGDGGRERYDALDYVDEVRLVILPTDFVG